MLRIGLSLRVGLGADGIFLHLPGKVNRIGSDLDPDKKNN